MAKLTTNVMAATIVLVLIVLRVVGFVDGIFFGVMSGLFLVLGFVLTVFFLGSEKENTGVGKYLILYGIVMVLVLVFVNPLAG